MNGRESEFSLSDESNSSDEANISSFGIDDLCPKVYEKRLKRWEEHRNNRNSIRLNTEKDSNTLTNELNFSFYKNESLPDVVTEDGLLIPAYISSNLYPYQHEGVEWLWKLHQQNAGGIMGDEMGLGKTVQLISFLGSLSHTETMKLALIVCPATLLFNWLREFHKWYPSFRIILLHNSGKKYTKDSPDSIVNSIVDSGGILITTYATLRQYQAHVLPVNWEYVILDEGHCIRNPDAEITLVCKQLRSVHRIILTGTPIQNNLRELWSLFDFVFPGRLGTLPTFEDEFVLPIRQGGYTKASKMQILMAYKCAVMLRDLISPYLLRRMKNDIGELLQLPSKTEQIIFCNLTKEQRAAYLAFLSSQEVQMVLTRSVKPFRALNILRKLCNHVDLVKVSKEDNSRHGTTTAVNNPWYSGCRIDGSGKLLVVQKVLNLWKSQRHRVLLFCQTRQMLDGIEKFIISMNWKYCRLDGSTYISKRQTMIDQYNTDQSIYIFLLTTRAGGVGINLMGADRVLIFDPDWNPSTDMQARERAWRLGQERAVTIYRLITCGTIEEKIYQRQLFKQYLTNKVLNDPMQRRIFNRNVLSDLFTLSDELNDSDTSTGTETGDMFLAGHVKSHTSRPTRTSYESTNIDDRYCIDAELEQHLKDVAKIQVDSQRLLKEQKTDIECSKEFVGADRTDNHERDNKAILDSLFGCTDIKSVFSHDALEGDNIHNKETDLMELESERIAKEAVRALRRSRDSIRELRSGVFEPTWTGKSGTAGEPSIRHRFGKKTIKSIKQGGSRKRKNDESVFGNSRCGFSHHKKSTYLNSHAILKSLRTSQNSRITSKESVRGENSIHRFKTLNQLSEELLAFLLKSPQSGMLTEDILREFGDFVDPKDKISFRRVLRDIARYQGGMWKVKEEFMC